MTILTDIFVICNESVHHKAAVFIYFSCHTHAGAVCLRYNNCNLREIEIIYHSKI